MKKLLYFCLFGASVANSEYITVFAHGIIDSSAQSARFQKAISTPQLVTPNFDDSTVAQGINFNSFLYTICSYFGKNVNRNAMFMGQKNDIAVIDQTIGTIPTQNNLILYGCSRGAATLLSYLAAHNPDNVSALVLDACPANMPDTIKMNLAQLGINPAASSTIFSYIFPQYDPATAVPPIEAIQNITNKNLPILLLHSLQDSLVHYTNSLKLYQALQKAGFKNVHLCILPAGRHSFLLQDPTIQELYTHAVHSFYKQYGLPYNPDCITAKRITNCIADSQIDTLIKEYNETIAQTYANQQRKNIYISCTAISIALLYWYIKNSTFVS